MDKLGDHSARYVDGALGGWKNTLSTAGSAYEDAPSPGPGQILDGIRKVFTSSNVNAKVRFEAGKAQGFKDAESIIDNLTEGETIKVVSHSMGIGYGRGYVAGIRDYANTYGKKVTFSYELDVNAFEGKNFPTTGEIPTQNKTGGKDGGKSTKQLLRGNSVPTVAPVKGAENTTSESDENEGHAVKNMSVDGVPAVGGAGTSTQKPIEEGNNNSGK